MANLERLFRRYQQRQDVRALGRVFDRTAPEILRVALHFAGDLSRAEELLQDTFLTAMRQAGRFDATQKLVPWLLGILANHARNGRRRDRRVPDPERVVLRAVPEVDAGAQASESTAALHNAIDALREPYREVLVLHLRHDLSATAIAHALDRAPATVRSQLHRGLEKLRDRLPGGLRERAVGTVVGLGAIREHVLREASATAVVAQTAVGAVTTAALSWGGLGMGKKAVALGIGGVLLAATGGALVWTADRSPPKAETHDAPTPLTRQSDASPPAIGPTLVGAPRQASNTPSAPRPASLPTGPKRVPLDTPIPEGKGSVAGKLIYDDGTPVSGKRVALWGSSRIEDVTDEHGAFHLHGEWVASRGVYFRGPHEWDALHIKEVQMKKDERVFVHLTVQRGHELEGTLRDARTGDALIDTQVILRRPRLHNAVQAGYASDHTDENGTFRIDHLPPARYSILVKRKGYQPHFGYVEVVDDMRPLDIRLQAARPLRVRFEGISPGAQGTRLNWMFHALNRESVFSPDGQSMIDEHGEVRIDAPPPGTYEFTLHGTKYTPRIERNPFVVGEGPLPPLILKVSARRRLIGTVRSSLGKPIPMLELSIGNASTRSGVEGRFVFETAPEGEQVVWARHRVSQIRVGTVVVRGAPETHADISMPGAARIRATFSWKGQGEALGSVKNEQGLEVARLRTRNGAVLDLPHLAAGAYELLLFRPGSASFFRQIQLGDSQILDLHTITLAHQPPVPVQVSMTDGKAPPRSISVRDVNQRGPVRTSSDHPQLWLTGGKGRLVGLVPGRYELVFSAPGYLDIEGTLDVRAEDNPLLELEFDPR